MNLTHRFPTSAKKYQTVFASQSEGFLFFCCFFSLTQTFQNIVQAHAQSIPSELEVTLIWRNRYGLSKANASNSGPWSPEEAYVIILWVTTGPIGSPIFHLRLRPFWGRWAGCLHARWQTDRITVLLPAAVKAKISNSSRVRPLSAHLPSSSLVPPCVFKRAFTAASAASCPQGTAVFVLMAGSHPLFFICSRFADLTFCCPLLYVPIMTGGRWRGLCIPLGSHVGKKYSLTAACCSFKTHRTKMLTWQRQSEVTCWEFKREGKKTKGMIAIFFF